VATNNEVAAAVAADNDDEDDDVGVKRYPLPRRRSRPDLVPRPSSSLTTQHHQELNKLGGDDVTPVICQLPAPVRCHCVPVSQSDLGTLPS